MPIVFENVKHTYAKKTPFQFEALNGISVTIPDHVFTAVVGHTGSGKTTLIQHINALLLPTEGKVNVNGFVLESNSTLKKVKLLRKDVGLVFQFPEYQLFEDTVENDVAFGPKNFGANELEAKQAAHEALKLVGLNESYYARSPFELSGGERRRVAIAGIIAMKPSILILDEPTAGLDPRGSIKMMELFKHIHARGTTIILVTHDMNLVVQYCDHVLVMQEGKVAIQTTPKQLFETNYEIYHLEIPLIYQLQKKLQKKGFNISLKNAQDLSSFAAEIVALKSK
jgi:energy-coupling factor transport system ATP-binding protein